MYVTFFDANGQVQRYEIPAPNRQEVKQLLAFVRQEQTVRDYMAAAFDSGWTPARTPVHHTNINEWDDTLT